MSQENIAIVISICLFENAMSAIMKIREYSVPMSGSQVKWFPSENEYQGSNIYDSKKIEQRGKNYG